ncbi:MAG TPA: TlpA disulfide reductase family protein [Longimicrobiales bacterium]|nr:TlpA disulfide reductase family protein [Longimicrobiales bacterium]
MTDSPLRSCRRLVPALALALVAGGLAASGAAGQEGLAGPWRAQLDLAGGPLRFQMELAADATPSGTLCNGAQCDAFSAVRALPGDSVLLEMGDYAAVIRAHVGADSLVGFYRNVGNRGPRTIPFRAGRGAWPVQPPPASLTGRWDAVFTPDVSPSPRVLELRGTERGLEGTVISNTGDAGLFWGGVEDGRFVMSHFDGSFVYMLTGELDGDTLRGVFHAGLTSQRPFVAVRSTGAPHLKAPTEMVEVDTTAVFEWDFPDLDGTFVSNLDERFRDKVVIVEIFGTWCPTCHDSAPVMVELYDRFRDRGLEIVGLAYEVTGDPDVDGALVRRFAEKFGIEYPLLLAGVNDDDSPRETQPQLDGPIAFPTTIFLDPSGRVRRVHSGFYGPALGEANAELEREFIEFTDRLLREAGR